VAVTAALAGTDRASHFHPGSVAAPISAPPQITLVDVSGTTNTSYTEVDTFDAGGEVSYDDLLSLDSYVNVHVTADGGASICSGDVGSNAP